MSALQGAWVVMLAAVGGWLSIGKRGAWGERFFGLAFLIGAWCLGVLL